MVWKHIFWNDDFIVTNKDDWEYALASKLFSSIQFEVYCAMRDRDEWPRFHNLTWDFRLKHIFLEILDFVKKGVGDGPSGSKNSPKIHSIIIAKNKKPHISIMIFDENQKYIDYWISRIYWIVFA